MLFDLRFAFRQLVKNPGFTVVAALTLALGIGVNSTMFTLLNALVLQASPAPDSGRLVCVFRTSAQSQAWPLSPANFYDYQQQNTSFERLAAFFQQNFNLAEPGQPAERLAGMSASGDFFTIYGIAPLVGRAFGPEADLSGAPKVAVLSEGFWRSHYAADPGIVGRVIRVDGQQVTIVGVMPEAFSTPMYWGQVDMWRNLSFDGATRQVRDNNWMQAIGRLKPGVALGQAQGEASAIASRLAHDYPQTNAGNGLRLALWNDTRTNAISRRISWLCMGLAGFVLLIACANLANLQLARMSERLREHAVRIALGASRLQLMRQLLAESLLLSALGGIVGILIAAWGNRLISAEMYVPNGDDPFVMRINSAVLVFTLVASVVTGVLAGTLPAWIASRTDVNGALKQGARGSSGDRSRHLLRQALIVGELALALVLLSGAGYFVRGMQRVASADMGWRPDGLITASMSLPFNSNYSRDTQTDAFFDKLGAKLAELPGAQQETIAAYLPVLGSWRSSGITVDGRARPAHGKEPLAYFNSVTPGHFSALGMRLISGRDFTAADRRDARGVAIIDEDMARDLWPGENPIGKRLADASPSAPAWLEVVGVVNHVRSTLELVRPSDTPFQVYLPLSQTPGNQVHYFNIALRSSAPVPAVAAALRGAVQAIDPDQPVYAIVSARDSMEQITGGFRMVSEMLGTFAAIGLVLSAVGIYGVISSLVAQRTAEFGIRMALGAQARDVLWLVLGQGVRLAAMGTALGLLLSWGQIRVLNAALPAIPGGDPVAVACVAALLAAVAMAASWLPARAATRVDPIIALRAE